MNFRVTPLSLGEQLPFDIALLEQALNNALDRMAEDAKKKFESTVATWDHRPNFFIYTRGYGRQVTTASSGMAVMIYNQVNNGNNRFIIPGPGKKKMKFMKGGIAKTSPGTLGSSSGTPGEDGPNFARVVHQTIKPREFDKMVQEYVNENFSRYVEEEVGKLT